MAKYEKITRYIEALETSEPGVWVVDRENDGSMEHPIHMPYVSFSEAVHGFIEDIHNAWDDVGAKDYIEVLKTHGIEWDHRSMVEADVAALPDEAVVALLLAAVRADRFCEGALLEFIKEGHIVRWLKILLERDQSH